MQIFDLVCDGYALIFLVVIVGSAHEVVVIVRGAHYFL